MVTVRKKQGDRHKGVHDTVLFLFMFKILQIFTKMGGLMNQIGKILAFVEMDEVCVTFLSTFLHVPYFN